MGKNSKVCEKTTAYCKMRRKKMFIRLAYRQMEQERKLNWLVVFQQIVVFILCICCVSVLLSETKYLSGFWKYLKPKGVYVQCDGIVDEDTMKMVQNSSWLEKRMNKAHSICCYSVVGEGKNKKNGEAFQMEGRAYDQEIINAYEPEMLEGKWLDKIPEESERLHVVISENTLGLKTGDNICIYGDETGNPIEAVIVGVIKNQEKIFGYSCIGETDNDYRMFYEMRDIETEKKPIVLMEHDELEAYISEHHNSAQPVINNSIIFIYDKNITSAEIEENKRFLAEECEVNIIQGLNVIKKNSSDYLWSRLAVVFPVFICVVILTILTQITISVIIGKRNLRYFIIYRLCGAEKRGVAKITLIQSMAVTGKAIVIALFIVYIFQISGRMDVTIIRLGMLQLLACIFIGVVQILISCDVQWSVMRNMTIMQGLNNTNDSEG